MTYRELQTALKNLRNVGYDVQVKLTASFDTLQAEYNRLTAISPVQTDSIPIAIASQQLEEPTEQASLSSESLTTTNKQPSNSLQGCQGYSKDIGLSAKASYWIDGTELGQKLSPTQAQALRNLEDGFKWLVKLPDRLKAFEQGFREGLKNTPIRQRQTPSQPQVIPIYSKRRQPMPMAA